MLRAVRVSLVGVLCCSLAAACDSSADQAVDKGKQAAGQAGDKAAELAGDALDASKKAAGDAVDKGKLAAGDLVDGAGDKAKSWWDELPDSGQLSTSASGWLNMQAKSAGGGIEAAIVKGQQIAPTALEIGSNVRKAVDSDTLIEPIYQEVDDGGRSSAEVDAAIGDMPRTEVIGGVTVGFKQMDELSEKRSLKERGYLVMWRQGDHLVGFVYRSRREIDIDKVVAEAPKLVALVQRVAE